MIKLLKMDFSTKDRIFGLDLLRAFAILEVVLGHGDWIVRTNFPNYINFWLVDGVDCFFVLSGFLIGSILIKSFEKNGISKYSVANFWKRRWFRTLPNYYMVIFIFLVYLLIRKKSFGDFSIDYLFFVQNFFKPHPSFFQVAWSLAIEEWFYLLFPFFILIINKLFPKLSIKNIILITICIFLIIPLLYRLERGAFFVAEENTILIWDTLFRKTVVARLDTIVFGVLGAYFFYYHPNNFNKFKYIKFLIGIVFIYLAQTKMNTGLLQFTIYFDFLSLGILLLIPLLNSIKNVKKIILIPITYISLISYSMYLIHLTFVYPLVARFKPYSDPEAIFFYIVYLFITIVISIFIYKFYEKPMMNLREKTNGFSFYKQEGIK